MTAKTTLSPIAVCIFLSACSSSSTLEFAHMLPVPIATASASISVACASDDTVLFEATGKVSVGHIAGETAKNFTLGGAALRDGKYVVEFYPDQRLKGINSNQAGQGADTLKAVLTTLAPTLATGNVSSPPIKDEDFCRKIANVTSDKSTPITIRYHGETKKVLDETTGGNSKNKEEYTTLQLKQQIGTLDISSAIEAVKFKSRAIRSIPPPLQTTGGSVITLPRQKVIETLLEICVKRPTGTDTPQCSSFYTDAFVVSSAETYPVALPEAGLFGSREFGISLTESGGVSRIQFSDTGGFTEAINGGNSVLDTFRPSTSQEKAAALNSEADLIAAQERLLRCRAKPADC